MAVAMSRIIPRIALCSELGLLVSNIVGHNGISQRYLHPRFRQTEMLVSEWGSGSGGCSAATIPSPHPGTCPINRRNRVLDGTQQFIPFQQTLARTVRPSDVRGMSA
jgi:hypothetical protein